MSFVRLLNALTIGRSPTQTSGDNSSARKLAPRRIPLRTGARIAMPESRNLACTGRVSNPLKEPSACLLYSPTKLSGRHICGRIEFSWMGSPRGVEPRAEQDSGEERRKRVGYLASLENAGLSFDNVGSNPLSPLPPERSRPFV